MKFEDSFIVVGCPLSSSFRADARLVGSLEAMRRKNVITYYPSSGAAEIGYDRIVKFAKSIEPKPTHILFVDYDVLPRHNTLRKLFEHDKDVISGVYPACQKFKISWCLSRDEDFKLMDFEDLPNNPFKVHVACNGMLLVKMEVFDNIEWPYWRTEYFEEGQTKGADLYFFDKVREAGYDIWVDPKLKCGHFKTVDLLGVANTYNKKGKKQ